MGAVGTGMAISAVLANARTLSEGAFYSFGMEVPKGVDGGAILTSGKPSMIFGNMYMDPTDLGSGFTKNASAFSIKGDRILSGVAKPTIGNAILPISMTTIGGLQALYQDGGEGLGRFLIEDFFANYYGNKQAEISTRNLTGLSKAIQEQAKAEGLDTLTQYRKSTLLGGMGGRMLPLMGAYGGAALGFSAGQSIGSGLGNLMGTGEGTTGLVGGILGARTGAALGAMATSSLSTAIFTGLVVGGANIATNVVGDYLKSGFKNNRTRGLDFAGDISAYYNNAAVTMRQRSVQAMHKSHLNARSALGQEASIMHMNRDYFAHHRRL